MFLDACEARDDYVDQVSGTSRKELLKMPWDSSDPVIVARRKAMQEARFEAQENPEYERLQKLVTQAAEVSDRARIWYFRARLLGMSELREFMHKLDMVDVRASWPEFPDPEAYSIPKITREYVNRDGKAEHYQDDDEESDEYTAYRADVEAVLGFTTQPVAGIPAVKLSDNSGWWIKPEEIETALIAYEANRDQMDWRYEQQSTRAYDAITSEYDVSGKSIKLFDVATEERQADQAVLDENRELFERWIEFLRGAKEHGGCTVH